MIKEVIFDIDGTIYNYNAGHAEGMKKTGAYVQEHFGISWEQFNEDYDRAIRQIDARLGSDNAAIHSRNIRFQTMLEGWGQPLFPHLKEMYHGYWWTLLDAAPAEPGILNCVQELSEMGITVGIGTDMTTLIQYEKLERYGLAPYVSHIVTSQEAGVEKPHPVFMDLCIQKSGVKAEECAFVGDSFAKDVCGSAARGMHAVWYNPTGKDLPKGAVLPEGGYHEIRHFDELVPYIRTLK